MLHPSTNFNILLEAQDGAQKDKNLLHFQSLLLHSQHLNAEDPPSVAHV